MGTDTDDTAALTVLLGAHPPFDALPAPERSAMARAADVRRFGPGELILDAFTAAGVEVFLVMAGQVDLWDDADRLGEAADGRLGVGGIFGFSAMLTERSLGPRAVAVDGADGGATVAAIPAAAVEPAFASPEGARFLANQRVDHGAPARQAALPSYGLVADLIEGPPLVVAGSDAVADVAARMTEHGASVAVVDLGQGRRGLVTDALLRRRVIVEGVPGGAPAGELCADTATPTVDPADSAAEALLLMLDRNVDHLLVTDREGHLRGVLGPRQFAVSPAGVGVSVHEQIRRATTPEELSRRARRVPGVLGDLLSGGLATTKVIAVYSAILDTVVRRALAMTFERHPELSLDAFTWLALGSNGRREAVLSSDVDSAVAFVDPAPDAAPAGYRAAFAEVDDVLAASGLTSDAHGATARRPAFSRTNAAWRDSARGWLAAPEDNQGAIMTSLLVDGRPIHGDPGLPAVTRVFGELRGHPGTMRLLLQASLSTRARSRPLRDVIARRDTVDLKEHALLPVVSMARWAALSVGSTALSTTERLRAAAGSTMFPAEQAGNLVEVVDILQRLRLRYQLIQYQRGERPSDVVARERMSPIDRSVLTDAAREIAAAQRRMDKIAAYLPVREWVGPAPH